MNTFLALQYGNLGFDFCFARHGAGSGCAVPSPIPRGKADKFSQSRVSDA